MWYVGHETRGVVPLAAVWGLAKHKVCPRGTTTAMKHYCPFPPLLVKYRPEPRESHAREQDAAATTARQMSQFHGKRTENPAKKIRLFYLVGESYSTLT